MQQEICRAWRSTSSSRATRSATSSPARTDPSAVGVLQSLRHGADGRRANSGFTLPNAGEQICGFVDLNPTSRVVPFFIVQRASNFGDVSDVYTGYDST